MTYAVLADLEARLKGEHLREQAYRFGRVFAWSAIAMFGARPAHASITVGLLVSVGVGALETAFRQVFPAVTTSIAMPYIDHAVQTAALDAADAAIAAAKPHIDAAAATAAVQPLPPAVQ